MDPGSSLARPRNDNYRFENWKCGELGLAVLLALDTRRIAGEKPAALEHARQIARDAQRLRQSVNALAPAWPERPAARTP